MHNNTKDRLKPPEVKELISSSNTGGKDNGSGVADYELDVEMHY